MTTPNAKLKKAYTFPRIFAFCILIFDFVGMWNLADGIATLRVVKGGPIHQDSRLR
jgi:hypothetical protein